MEMRSLGKYIAFFTAVLVLTLALVARTSAQELLDEECGAWVEKTVNGITFMEWQEMTPEEMAAYQATIQSTRSTGHTYASYFAMHSDKTNPTHDDFPKNYQFVVQMSGGFAQGILTRNDSYAIMPEPKPAGRDGYFLVWYEGIVYDI